MDLLRLPLLPLIEIFKYMDFREKFFISLLSKRARKILKSLSVPSPFAFSFTESLHIRLGHNVWDLFIGMTPEEDCIVGGEVMRMVSHPDGLVLKDESFEKQLLLANYVLDTFQKSTISITVMKPTLPASALEFMKMINQKKLSIKTFYYHIDSESSEFIPKILDECTEVTDEIVMHAFFPDDFVYTPSRPFKAKDFRVKFISNWFNLENFLSCRRIDVKFMEPSNRTAETYKSFFTKWMDSEDAQLQRLYLSSIEDTEKQLIMDAIKNQGTTREISDKRTEVTRENGSQLYVYKGTHFIEIITKQMYLENYDEEGVQWEIVFE
uniref:F-box domain-containing protein n=1 Tax=Caenorhabditis tropicalis TaxID=1561998 RepID=A0A1I7UTP7_9PELO